MVTADWFWLSFVDGGTGSFLGVAVVDVSAGHRAEALEHLAARGLSTDDDAVQVASASFRAWELGCNPGGEMRLWGPLDPGEVDGHVPESYRRRLLSAGEAYECGADRAYVIDAREVDGG